MASQQYRTALAAYLSSPLGRSTSPRVVAFLEAVDPVAYGMGAAPSSHAIHAARAYLESVHAEDSESAAD